MPDQHFDLIACRNVVFTYFAPALQDELAQQLLNRLHPGGALVLGVPPTIPAVIPWRRTRTVLRLALSSSAGLAVV